MKPFGKRPGPYTDLAQVPETMVGERVGGEVVASPRPGFPHSNAGTGLAAALRNPFQHGDGGPGGWWILLEPELHLGDDVVVPDLAGWRRERLPELPTTAYSEVAPDWICEVLSPSTAGLDRMRKMPIYHREGVGHVWLVDPALQTIEVFRRAETAWLLVGSHVGEEPARLEPFEAHELQLARLWSR